MRMPPAPCTIGSRMTAATWEVVVVEVVVVEEEPAAAEQWHQRIDGALEKMHSRFYW